MPFSPCCKRKYSKPCKCSKCSAPYNNCQCISQRVQCPPPTTTTEDDDTATVQLYTPVIAAAPVSKKCCCCELKPKKSLWQQLFGDRKYCCAPTPKKKQDCFCKPKKKQRCVPECTLLCCNDSKRPSSPASKPCKPLCCCKKLKACKCKTSSKPYCPTLDSIFGCHFYCNLENRENRAKQSRRRICCCCCCSQSSSSPAEATDPATTEGECEELSYDYTNNSKRRLSNNCCERYPEKPREVYPEKPREVYPEKPREVYPEKPREVCPEKQREVCPEIPRVVCPEIPKVVYPEIPKDEKNIDKPTRSNFHIGLTFTNTETKYYKNNCECPPIEEETKNNDENEDSSSEQIITLEIHQSNSNEEKGKNKVQEKDKETNKMQEKYKETNKMQENNRDRDEETANVDSSKRRKLSSLREENAKNVTKSESYSREILPLEERLKKGQNMHENNSGILTKSREKRMKNSVMFEDNDLDKRVSEILRRLRTIESKLNNFDSHKTDTQTFKIETEGNKSIISFHFKDENNDSFESNSSNKTNRNGNKARKPHAVIEIRKTRSKSYSPMRKGSSTRINRYDCSRSLDRASRAQRVNPKLVIKFPHGNKVSEGFVSMSGRKRTKHLDYHSSEWMEISNELKKRNHVNATCYCYDCVCKRVICR